MRVDPFTRVMGERRGAGREESELPAARWWRWPNLYRRLSEWLDEVARVGYVELVLFSASAVPAKRLLRAYPKGRTGDYAAIELDEGEAMWLEDQWPRRLITERAEDYVRGWLSQTSP